TLPLLGRCGRGCGVDDLVSPSHHGYMDHGLGDVNFCWQPSQDFGSTR
ncbi:hypothetical protein A2U01_0048590, partial [Trifolium medium]|nr:hypothetical protein [Trifolium medium]